MRYVLIKKAAELLGYTPTAIEGKIAQSVWLEGEHYVKAPDGRVFIDLEEVERWITGGLKSVANRSGSRSRVRGNAAARL